MPRDQIVDRLQVKFLILGEQIHVQHCASLLGVNCELLSWQKDFKRQVNKIRYVIEQGIANFKTWRIMHIGYRRPLAIFPKPSQL